VYRQSRRWTSYTAAVQAFVLTLCLQDDPLKISEYRRYHQAVWPEVTARLRECGVQQMQIFLRGRRMFMYLVTDDHFDPARDFARINEDPTSARWNELMATLQERAPEANADEWWAPMERVFDLQETR
jgi:L-rhamnose mutarotase